MSTPTGDLVKILRDTHTVYRFDGFSDTVKESITVPATYAFTWGVACYEGNLYTSESNNAGLGKIRRHVGFSAAVVEELTFNKSVAAIAFDENGNLFWNPWDNSDIVYRQVGFSTTDLDNFTGVGGSGQGLSGLAHDGTNVLSTAYAGTTIRRYVGFSATPLDSFTGGGAANWGMTWDGSNAIADKHSSAVRYTGMTSTQQGTVTYPASNQGDITWFIEQIDVFTVGLEFKNASSVFAPVTAALGDTGANVESGSHTAYWDNPSQDRPNVEITDEQMRLEAIPDGGNKYEYTLSITNASQLTVGDGTGSIGDVKIEYAFSQVYAPVLLLHMDGTNGSTTFTDSSVSAHTMTANGNAQVSTTSPKFGTGSALFAGGSDSVSMPFNSDIDFLALNFTIECWVKTTGTTMGLWGTSDSGGNNVSMNAACYISPAGKATGVIVASGGSLVNQVSTTSVNDGVWHHIALVRNGDFVTIYIDGIAEDTDNIAGWTLSTPTTPFGVGCLGPNYIAGYRLIGNIDELRIIKGAAVYTSNFAPPTAPY